jgi:hypothetical protein
MTSIFGDEVDFPSILDEALTVPAATLPAATLPTPKGTKFVSAKLSIFNDKDFDVASLPPVDDFGPSSRANICRTLHTIRYYQNYKSLAQKEPWRVWNSQIATVADRASFRDSFIKVSKEYDIPEKGIGAKAD